MGPSLVPGSFRERSLTDVLVHALHHAAACVIDVGTNPEILAQVFPYVPDELRKNGAGNKMEQQVTSKSLTSGAVIQIASIPRQFHIDSFGSLSEFFLPLLDLTRQAVESQKVISNHKDNTTAYNAASLLAGELLREGNCMIGREFLNVANCYQIDFEHDQFGVTAQVFAVGGGTAAFFFVRITGKIMADDFSVADPRTNKHLFHFSEDEARKPDFFSRDFPFIANQSRLNPSKIDANGVNAANDQAVDIQTVVSVLGEDRAVRISKQKGEGRLDVQDVEHHTRVAYFPASCISDFPKLMLAIQEYMTQCTQAGSSHQDALPVPAAGKHFTKVPTE